MLEYVTDRVDRFIAGLTGKPDRDALAAERAQLLAAAPQEPAPTGPRPTCRCHECSDAWEDAEARRLAIASWEAQRRRVEVGLFRSAFGEPGSRLKRGERDELGQRLATLYAELLKDFDATRAIDWRPDTTRDGDLEVVSATERRSALAERLAALGKLTRQVRDDLPYLGSDDLTKALAKAEERRAAILDASLDRPADPEALQRAGIESAQERTEADKHGLVPGPTPDILTGTVRFSGRGSA